MKNLLLGCCFLLATAGTFAAGTRSGRSNFGKTLRFEETTTLFGGGANQCCDDFNCRVVVTCSQKNADALACMRWVGDVSVAVTPNLACTGVKQGSAYCNITLYNPLNQPPNISGGYANCLNSYDCDYNYSTNKCVETGTPSPHYDAPASCSSGLPC